VRAERRVWLPSGGLDKLSLHKRGRASWEAEGHAQVRSDWDIKGGAAYQPKACQVFVDDEIVDLPPGLARGCRCSLSVAGNDHASKAVRPDAFAHLLGCEVEVATDDEKQPMPFNIGSNGLQIFAISALESEATFEVN
jgi:hypothetical protein